MQRSKADNLFNRVAVPMLRRGLGRIKVMNRETGWTIALLDRPRLSAFVTVPDVEMMDDTELTRELNSQIRAIIKEVNAREDTEEQPPERRFP